jgi:hypothetical protein
MAKYASAVNIAAPYSPRLTTRARGPHDRIARAARMRFGSPESCRASASLMMTTSTALIASLTASGTLVIQ